MDFLICASAKLLLALRALSPLEQGSRPATAAQRVVKCGEVGGNAPLRIPGASMAAAPPRRYGWDRSVRAQ